MTSRPMQPPGPLPNRPYPQVAQAPRLNPIFRLLLLGIHASKSSPLRVLRRDCNATMLIFEAMEELWDSHVDWSATGVHHSLFSFEFPPPLDSKSFQGDYNQGFASGYNFNFYWGPERNFGHIMKRPPPPKVGDYVPVHINMMPIVMGHSDSLPPVCKRYNDIINRCLHHCPEEGGEIGYLTIHEDFVPVGNSQRRPGIHCESPGVVLLPESACENGSIQPLTANWGYGDSCQGYSVKGGIFMASSVDDSCRVWDCVVRDHHEIVADNLGDLEHLRRVLARPRLRGPANAKRKPAGESVKDEEAAGVRPGKLVEANSMIWMTDRTPHESVPIEVPGAFRQYFRLVTSQVSVWYEEHSTKNELGIVPPKKVVIVKGNKFSDSERSKAGSMGTRPFPSSNYLATVRGSAEFLKQGEALWELFTRLNLHDRQECGQNNIDGSLEVQSALVKWLQMLPSKFQLSLNEEDISERMTTMENSAWCGQSTLFILFHGIMCCSSLRTRVWSINSASRVAKDNNTERNKPKERPDTNDVSNKSASAAVGTGTLPDIRGLIYETKANINDRVETASVVALESAEAVCTLLAMIQRSVSYAANFPMLKSTKLSGKSKRKAKSGQSSSVGSGSGGVGPRNGVPPEDFVRSVWSPSSSASLWLLVVEAAVTIFISTLTAVDSSSVLQGVQPYTDEATNYLKNVTSFFRTFVGYRLERSIRRLIELLDEPQKLSVEVACNVAIATIEEAVAVANGCNDDDFDGESGPSKEDRNVKTPPLMALEQSLLKMADVARKIGIAQVFK